jgi:hypothetical protein
MSYSEKAFLQEAQSDEPSLSIVESFIFHGDRMTVERRLNADEVDTVLSEIGNSLCFIPLELHRLVVAT